MDELVEAAIAVARVTCKIDSEGCDGPWCSAQRKLRAALAARNIEWKPSIEADVKKLETERDAAVAAQDYLKAALLQDQIAALKATDGKD